MLAAALLLPIILLPASWAAAPAVNAMRADAFYEKHQLLAALRAATNARMPGTTVDAARVAVLVDRIPFGTSHAEVVRRLALEGFDCRRWNSSRSSYAVDCPLVSQPDYVQRWWVQIDFDNEGKLTQARAFALKSSELAY